MEDQISLITKYQDVFQSDKGQDVLYDLCKRFKWFSSSYNGKSEDTFYHEGQRSVLIFLMDQLSLDPGKLLKEYKERLKEESEYEYE